MMNTSGSGVDELDPMKAIEEDVDSASPVVPWTDDDGKAHIDHPVHKDCSGPTYQEMRPEIDSEDGPPPRRSGPTS
ncbi:hypothetical protein [Amycolatopsis sp. RTGN1]|uniref:hypothetical protein n=1 Tax=Amycolatopsis ponsaeliensis TaxID=2992142 RepID=UPI00254C093C|nr:hypothetical protein [Amycolatopsis sp. RTGN1]